MKRLLLALALFAPLTLTITAQAADAAAAHDPFVQGDAAAGATKAAVCAACHGPGGNSAMPDWPKLAAQHSPYTLSQLKHFKAGERKNAIMMGQVAALSEQDLKDLAVYFAQQPASPGVASKDAVAVAEKLYRAGSADKGIPACTACHGPRGAGNAAAQYPRIGGQHAAYTATQLRAYRAGERKVGSGGQIMATLASRLSDEEIQALASYINGLQ